MNKQAEIDWPTVMKLFAGGALTGAGLGAGTSFMRYLQSLKDQAAVDTSADDDVLYLTLPPKPAKPLRGKRASTLTYATGGLAGVLGTILAYNAVRGAYQKQRKKQLQKELDEAQNIYLGGLTGQMNPPEAFKQASQFGTLTKGVGSLYLALFLAALGSGVVTNRMLQKQFPAVKNPNRNRPRKVVVRSQNDLGGTDDTTLVQDKPITPDAMEGLVRTDLQMPKVANADCSLADLVGAVAAGRGEEFRDNLAVHGLEVALDLVKGARFEKVSSLNRNLAITWICTDPMVSTAMQPIVAAEFQEGGGEWYVKAAAEIPEKFHSSLVGLVETSTQDTRRAFYAPIVSRCKMASIKQASPLEEIMLARGIGSLLAPQKEDAPFPEDPQSKKKPTQRSDMHVSEDSGPVDVELDNDEAQQFWGQYGKDIDSAIAKV